MLTYEGVALQLHALIVLTLGEGRSGPSLTGQRVGMPLSRPANGEDEDGNRTAAVQPSQPSC
jgi:hypothetical protein